MATEPLPRRRWFRFGLGWASVILAAVLTAFFGFYWDWLVKRRDFISNSAYSADNRDGINAPALLLVLGEQGYSHITVTVEAPTFVQLTEADSRLLRRAKRLFPEATLYSRHLTGTAYRGEHENHVRVPDE